MFSRLSQLRPKHLLFALAVVLVGGIGLAATIAPHNAPTAGTKTPHPSVSSSQAQTSHNAPDSPAVAGAATAAPSTAKTATSPATRQPASTPVPAVPQPHITLNLTVSGSTSTYSVRLLPGANACTVLEEARQEGKIQSVTITDKYMATLKSLFIEEINGVKNWNYNVKNGSPPGAKDLGCTYPGAAQPIDGSIVTWTH